MSEERAPYSVKKAEEDVHDNPREYFATFYNVAEVRKEVADALKAERQAILDHLKQGRRAFSDTYVCDLLRSVLEEKLKGDGAQKEGAGL